MVVRLLCFTEISACHVSLVLPFVVMSKPRAHRQTKHVAIVLVSHVQSYKQVKFKVYKKKKTVYSVDDCLNEMKPGNRRLQSKNKQYFGKGKHGLHLFHH